MISSQMSGLATSYLFPDQSNALEKFGLKTLQQFQQNDVVLHTVERAICNKQDFHGAVELLSLLSSCWKCF